MAKDNTDVVLQVTIKNGREVLVDGEGLERMTNYALQSIMRNLKRAIRVARANKLREQRIEERKAREVEEEKVLESEMEKEDAPTKLSAGSIKIKAK